MPLRIIAIPDMHAPFHSRSGLRQLYKAAEDLAPTHVIQLGDLYDFYSFSRYPRSLNLLTPKQEIEDARNSALAFWITMKAIAPRAKRYQLLGNHDSRVEKKISSLFPEAESLINAHAMFEFKGVETMESERQELVIEDILFQHGFRSKLGDHARHNSMKTVCGHSHRGGVVYQRLGDKVIWELNAGHLVDETRKPFMYTPQRLMATWTMGFGIIDQYGPRFVAL